MATIEDLIKQAQPMVEGCAKAVDQTVWEKIRKDITTRLIKTRDDLKAFHNYCCQAGLTILDKKNNDYAGDSGKEPFKNFERVGALGICRPSQGVLMRIADKFSRIITFENQGHLKVADESMEDTLIDMINYIVIYGAMKQNERLLGSVDKYKPVESEPRWVIRFERTGRLSYYWNMLKLSWGEYSDAYQFNNAAIADSIASLLKHTHFVSEGGLHVDRVESGRVVEEQTEKAIADHKQAFPFIIRRDQHFLTPSGLFNLDIKTAHRFPNHQAASMYVDHNNLTNCEIKQVEE